MRELEEILSEKDKKLREALKNYSEVKVGVLIVCLCSCPMSIQSGKCFFLLQRSRYQS